MQFFRHFLERKDLVFIQFVKYGIAGVISLVVELVVFYVCAVGIWTALDPGDPFVEWARWQGVHVRTVVDDVERTGNFLICKAVAFTFSNVVCYFLNVIFVFEGGRHRRHREALLFYMLSIGILLFSLGFSGLLIRVFGVSSTTTNAIAIALSLLFNFSGRKCLVFRR